MTRDGTTAFSSQKYACAGGGMALALFAQLRLRWSVLQVIGAAAALGVARQLLLLGSAMDQVGWKVHCSIRGLSQT